MECDIKDGVHQGLILGPLFFKIHICDLSYIMRKWPIANYTDDTTPYTGGKNTQDVIKSLEHCALVLYKWCENDLMKANSDKSHLLLSTSTSSTANINGDIIKNSESEKFLEAAIDYKLNFEEHLSNVFDKASQKLNTLARISSNMNINQRKRVMRAFISSQFEYCPLAWFFCSRKINDRMKRIQERALRIVCKDYVSTFSQLLEKDSSVSIHIRNLQVLATEIFKARNNLSPPILQNIFRTSEPTYSLRRDTIFESRRIQTQRYGIKSLTYLGPKIWSQLKSKIFLKNMKYYIKIFILKSVWNYLSVRALIYSFNWHCTSID